MANLIFLRSYFSEVAVERIKATNHGKSYLPEVAVEQIEVTNLISLKLQWSKLNIDLISLKLQWSRLKIDIISLKLQWSRLKPQVLYPKDVVEWNEAN
ncbi:hypothetical protein J1N35_022461 [Gossypium stocksii]|uniref:Uncharacterized protein n=1 Tax=Gossypium stocksii TaxID=47602 RepID=A0A9D3VG62_9ROSI|nr:hypothetical protein J1N35_022461 [Gossypium stocksii]